MRRFRQAIRGLLGAIRTPGDGLSVRAVSAGFWAFALRAVEKGFNTIRVVILGNLLTPNDFGIVGVAMLIIMITERVTQTGFRTALIQMTDTADEEDYLNAAWTLELARGLGLGAVMFFGAPLAGMFFDSPETVTVLRWMALGPVLSGVGNIGVIVFDRELLFKQRFGYRSVPVVTDLLLSAVAAFLIGSYWALVIGWLGGKLAFTIAGYVVHPFRPRIHFDRERSGRLFRYGRWIFGSEVFVVLLLYIDDVVVGRLLGTAALGLYQVAFSISQLATTEISLVVSEVAFPAYAKLQATPQRLGPAFLRVLRPIAAVVIPFTAGLWFVGRDAIDLILGEEWLPMVPAFQVLLVWGLIRALLAVTGPLFQGIGRPEIGAKIQGGQLAVLAVIVVPLTNALGIEGAALATVIAAAIPGAVAMVVAARTVAAPARSVVQALALPTIATGVMLAVLTLLQRGFAPFADSTLTFLWSPLIGVAVFAISIWVLFRLAGLTTTDFGMRNLSGD